jgi:hypothetical protein
VFRFQVAKALSIAAVLAWFAVAAACAPARTGRHWQTLSRRASFVVSDGSRYAAYQAVSGETRVIDAKRGTAFEEPTPEGYRVAAVGGGQLLWSERLGSGSVQAVILLDLATRRRHVPTGFDAFARDPGTSDQIGFDAVGRFGIAGTASGGPASYRVLYNWRTGAHGFDTTDPRRVVDLSRESLLTRLCAPLRDKEKALVYDRPYGLQWVRSTKRLELSKCGSRHRRVLSTKCRYPCRGYQLGGGVATWLESRPGAGPGAIDGRVVANDLSRNETWSWPRVSGSAMPIVVHTRTSVFVSTLHASGLEGTDPFAYTVRRARIPTVRR